MPEETEVQPEEEDDLLAALLADDDDEPFEEEAKEVEEEYEKEDEKVLARIRRQDEKISQMETERKVEKLLDTFEKKAPPVAQEWLSVMRTGKEDLKQLKGLMELANQKAKTLADKNGPEVSQEDWGSGPIKGSAEKKDEVEEHMKDLWERSKRDTKALAELILNHETVPADLRNRE